MHIELQADDGSTVTVVQKVETVSQVGIDGTLDRTINHRWEYEDGNLVPTEYWNDLEHCQVGSKFGTKIVTYTVIAIG